MSESRLTYNAAPSPEVLQEDQEASYWLKEAWSGLCERDPVDAANDAELLYMWSVDRVARVARGEEKKP